MADDPAAYLARSVAALTPQGRKRVDELLDQLAQAAGSHEWLVRFAKTLEGEADAGRVWAPPVEPTKMTDDELDQLLHGFLTIRDTEQLDDVSDWANAVIVLVTDERDRGFIG